MDEKRFEEIVTKFLLNTCRLRPQYSVNALEAAICSASLPIVSSRDGENFIPLTTGSVAEFYIEPMLPHVGDVDVMFHPNTELAIPRGHPAPTQLPDEFHNYVRVFEIVDSQLPGYVYLELSYELTKCVDEDKYNAVEYDREWCASNRLYSRGASNIHGPASLIVRTDPLLSIDHVHCLRCLVWLPQAAEWPTRRRHYGWPDSATVDHVVSNGCNVVPVAHRQCRQDELFGERQWRLSFSRAEIVLLNSWMPVQQIVYHMLRVFMKTERLTESADNSEAGTLSNYHIKTLMLWACELKPRNWWTDDLNLVRICVQLLHILADWLTDAKYQHYFINNWNLIDNSFTVTNIAGQLMSVDKTRLSAWFLDNYIRKCSQRTPYTLFDDVSTTAKLQNAISAVVSWRLKSASLEKLYVIHSAQFQTLHLACRFTRSLTVGSCVRWMTELAKFDSCFCVYYTAIVFLHVAYKSLRHGLDDELTDVLATLLEQRICTQRYSNNLISTLSLIKAVKLIKVVASKSLNTTSLIAVELSKAYLHKALRCKDSNSNSIYCLANVYLAVLYYTTGQYQTAIDHCTLVMRSQDHSQCSSHVVQGELLPNINEDIDKVLGLAVFYQHVRTAALNQQRQTQHVSVFTTELFAHYLYVRYLSVRMCDQFMQTSLNDKFKLYETCIRDTSQPFIGDMLLFASLRRLLKQKFQEQIGIVILAERNAPNMAQLLQKSAVEHLTIFRQVLARDFGCAARIVTTDFEAMYAYKRGDYQQCLQLSIQNVRMLQCGVCALDVPTFPQLLDDDIVSLIGLSLIAAPNCRRDLTSYVGITQVTLSLYLMTQCLLKLRHSVTSLAKALDNIEAAQRSHPAERVLDRLTLKLIERKVVAYLTTLD